MSPFLDIILRVLVMVAGIVLLTRLHGLRSFSKMSAFDFAITVAVGSVLAGAITTVSVPLWHFLVALSALFVLQICVAQFRARNRSVAAQIDNDPLLIMEDGKVLPDNLIKGGMTKDDLWAKLREANAYDLTQVRAVVMESTGDVSVLHGPPDGPAPSDEVMASVRRS